MGSSVSLEIFQLQQGDPPEQLEEFLLLIVDYFGGVARYDEIMPLIKNTLGMWRFDNNDMRSVFGTLASLYQVELADQHTLVRIIEPHPDDPDPEVKFGGWTRLEQIKADTSNVQIAWVKKKLDALKAKASQ